MGKLGKLAKRLRGAIREERALTEPIYKAGTYRSGISGNAQQPEPGRLVTDGFESTQATAARAIGARLSDLEFRVQMSTRRDGKRVWEDQPEHALTDVLEYPNPILSRRQMLKVTSYWLTQAGEAYWLIVTNGAGATRELWPMSPSNVEKLAGTTSPIEGFVFHGEQGETRYGIDEVVFMFDPDPADPFRGVGVVGPQARDFDAGAFASATLRSHFQHDATPKVVLTADTEADVPDIEQRKVFWEDWKNRFNRRGGSEMGVPAFLPSGFGIHELSSLGDVGAIREFMEFQRDLLLMANGVPRSILGDVVDANRAAADTNRLVFDRHTIKPQAGIICDALTAQLARVEYGPELRIQFEPFVDEDHDLRLREENQDLSLKVRSINQVLSDRGKDPVEWGADPIGTFADVPYTGDDVGGDGEPAIFEPGGRVLPSPPTARDGSTPWLERDGPSNHVRVISPDIAARFSSEAQWSRLMQSDAVFVPRMVSQLRRVFGAQKALTLDALENRPAGERSRSAALEAGRSYSRSDWVDTLFDTDDFSRIFDTLITPISLEVYQKAGENVLSDLEVRPSMSFDESALASVRKNGAQLVKLVNNATKQKIRATLAKGIEAGDSEAALARRVRKVFASASKYRARTIARTEVGHAVTTGQLAGYAESGVVTLKRWNTALDERVRDSHEIDGQTVREGEAFTLGDGENALGPRVAVDGGRLSARNAINCRCFTTPVLEGV